MSQSAKTPHQQQLDEAILLLRDQAREHGGKIPYGVGLHLKLLDAGVATSMVSVHRAVMRLRDSGELSAADMDAPRPGVAYGKRRLREAKTVPQGPRFEDKLVALVQYCEREKRAFPPQNNVALALGVTVSKVQKTLALLVEEGRLDRLAPGVYALPECAA